MPEVPKSLRRPQGVDAVLLTVDAIETGSKLYPGMDSLDKREFFIWVERLETLLDIPDRATLEKPRTWSHPDAVAYVRKLERLVEDAGYTIEREGLAGQIG